MLERVSFAQDDTGDYIARARALRPLITAHAARIEQEREIAPEVLSALHDAQLFRILIPKSCGGRHSRRAGRCQVLHEGGRGLFHAEVALDGDLNPLLRRDTASQVVMQVPAHWECAKKRLQAVSVAQFVVDSRRCSLIGALEARQDQTEQNGERVSQIIDIVSQARSS